MEAEKPNHEFKMTVFNFKKKLIIERKMEIEKLPHKFMVKFLNPFISHTIYARWSVEKQTS